MSERAQNEDKSRSQVKREFRELKDLGIRLAGLSKKQLSAVPLTDETRQVVLAAKEMARGALQRQYRYLASLLAEDEDVPAIRAALAGELRPHADDVAALHEAERRRDTLLTGGDAAVAEFVEHHPDCDRAQLRRLVRNAKKERELGKPPASSRLLFRYLRQLGSGSPPPQVEDEELGAETGGGGRLDE